MWLITAHDLTDLFGGEVKVKTHNVSVLDVVDVVVYVV